MAKRYAVFFLFFVLLMVALGLRGCSEKMSEGYRIARDPSWYPIDLNGKEKNVLAFVDDLLVSVAEYQGFHLSLLSVAAGGLELGVGKGDFEGFLSAREMTAQRRGWLRFSNPLFLLGPILVVPTDSTARSLLDMKDKRVGIQTGRRVIFGRDNFPAIILQPYRTRIKALESLLRGDLDGLIMDLMPAYAYTEGLYRGTLKVVGYPMTKEGIHLITARKKGDTLLTLFNDGLAHLVEVGAYQALLKKWALSNPLGLLEENDGADGEDDEET